MATLDAGLELADRELVLDFYRSVLGYEPEAETLALDLAHLAREREAQCARVRREREEHERRLETDSEYRDYFERALRMQERRYERERRQLRPTRLRSSGCDPVGDDSEESPAEPKQYANEIAVITADAHAVVNREAAQDGSMASRSVRDVLHGSVAGPCRLGKKASLTWRERHGGSISNRYFYCWGFKCPRCAPGQVMNGVRRCLEAWADDLDMIHRLELPEGERCRVGGVYPKRYLRVAQHDGGAVVFTPGPYEGAEPMPIDQLGADLAEAILDAPAAGRRFSWPTRTREGERVASRPERDPEREKPRRVNLPRDVTPEDACALYEEAVGRSLGFTQNDATKESWRSYDASDVGSDTIDLLREFVQEPLGKRYEAEREAHKLGRDLLRALCPQKDEKPAVVTST